MSRGLTPAVAPREMSAAALSGARHVTWLEWPRQGLSLGRVGEGPDWCQARDVAGAAPREMGRLSLIAIAGSLRPGRTGDKIERGPPRKEKR
jgi:hypothetical protein